MVAGLGKERYGALKIGQGWGGIVATQFHLTSRIQQAGAGVLAQCQCLLQRLPGLLVLAQIAIGDAAIAQHLARGQVRARELPLGQRESFSYDLAGRQISHTDFIGQVTEYDYDANDNISERRYVQAGRIEQIDYNALSQRVQAITAQGSTSWAYDARGRLIEVNRPNNERLSYAYDLAGNRTRVSTALGSQSQSVDYGFDANNRLITVTDAHGTTSYDYNEVGSRKRITHSNGLVTEYGYDALDRLSTLSSKDAQGNELARYDYHLHPTGRRLRIDEASGRSSVYSYDELFRLKTETITDPVHGNRTAAYRYDKVGNRTYSIVDGVHTEASFDANDRLIQQGGEQFSYDDQGSSEKTLEF